MKKSFENKLPVSESERREIGRLLDRFKVDFISAGVSLLLGAWFWFIVIAFNRFDIKILIVLGSLFICLGVFSLVKAVLKRI